MHLLTNLFWQVSYENRIDELQVEINQLGKHKQEVEVEYSTLKRTVKTKEEEGRKRLSIMEVVAGDCTALHCTALHRTALYCTALECTIVL